VKFRSGRKQVDAQPAPGAPALIVEERSGNRVTGYYVNPEH
jgi:hypothetical protein